MSSIEALWTVAFDDLPDAGAVVVFETGRVFGGDSAYYFTGRFQLVADSYEATLSVNHHRGDPATIWGDSKRQFSITVKLKRSGDKKMEGTVTRPDLNISQRITLTRRVDLP